MRYETDGFVDVFFLFGHVFLWMHLFSLFVLLVGDVEQLVNGEIGDSLLLLSPWGVSGLLLFLEETDEAARLQFRK